MNSATSTATVGRPPAWWRRAVVVVAGAALGLVVGLYLAGAQAQRYESDLQLLVGPIAGPRQTLDASGLLALTYAEALESNELVARTAQSIGGTLDTDEVTAIPNQQSRTVLVVVTSEDETVPQAAADTIAALMIDLTEQRVVPPDQSLDAGLLTVLDPASPPEKGSDLGLLTVLLTTAAGGAAGWGLTRIWPKLRGSGRPADTAFLSRLAIPSVVVDPSADAGQGAGFAAAARQLDVALATDDGSDLVSFVLLHDDPQLLDLVAQVALAAKGSRAIEIGDPDAVLADGLSVDGAEPERHRGVVPDGVTVHFGKREASVDVLERFGELVDTRTSGVSLWVVGNGLGSSALAALTSMVADSIVLVCRERSLTEQQLAEALAFLNSIEVQPTSILTLTRRGVVARTRLVRVDDVTGRLSVGPA